MHIEYVVVVATDSERQEEVVENTLETTVFARSALERFTQRGRLASLVKPNVTRCLVA